MYNPYNWNISESCRIAALEKEANKFGKLCAQKAILELEIQRLEELIETRTDELYDLEEEIERSLDAYRKLYI